MKKRVIITFIVSDGVDVNAVIESLRKVLHAMRISFSTQIKDLGGE
jgi:hypothetical protein